MSSEEEVPVANVNEEEVSQDESIDTVEKSEDETEELKDLDGLVVVGESYDMPEMDEGAEAESFDAIVAEDSYDALHVSSTFQSDSLDSDKDLYWEAELNTSTDSEDVLEEGAEIMQETLEDVLDEVDEIVEESRAESMEEEMNGDAEGVAAISQEDDNSSEDTVIGELEVSELNTMDGEPVLIREDEENNVVGVEDGFGEQFFSKLFGH